MELIGIFGDVEAPGATPGEEPCGRGALDVGGEAGVVEHLHGVELVEVDWGEPGEFRIEVVHGRQNSTNVRFCQGDLEPLDRLPAANRRNRS